MKESTRHSLLLILGAVLIVASLTIYATWIQSCGRPPRPSVLTGRDPLDPEVSQALAEARAAFREGFLGAKAHLRLSEALFRAGRPADAFFVMSAARALFGDETFGDAHAAVVLGRYEAAEVGETAADRVSLQHRLKAEPEDPRLLLAWARLAAQSGDPKEAHKALDAGLGFNPRDRGLMYDKAELTASTDLAAAVPLYARLVDANPDCYETWRALDVLGRLAQKSEDGPSGEAARGAREALDELARAHPAHPLIFTTLAMSAWARGDAAAARALAAEARARRPENTGAAVVEAALAFADHDADKALLYFSEAVKKNPHDLYSTAKLAQIYFRQRADRDAAFPYYLALYRRNPFYDDGESAESVVGETLRQKAVQVLSRAGSDGLSAYLQADDAALRAEACIRAGELGEPRWVSDLAILLDDDTVAVRRAAVAALVKVAGVRPGALLERREAWVADPRALARAEALSLFAELDPDDTFPFVLKLLKDPVPAVRYLAKTRALDRSYTSALAAKAGAHYLKTEKDPAVLALLRREDRRR